MEKFYLNGKNEFNKLKKDIDLRAIKLLVEKTRKTPLPIKMKTKEDFVREYEASKKVVLDTKRSMIDELTGQIEYIQTAINRIPDTLFFSANDKRKIAIKVEAERIDENIQRENVYARAERVFGDMRDYDRSNFLEKLISLFMNGFCWRQESYYELLVILKSMKVVLAKEKEQYQNYYIRIHNEANIYANNEYNKQQNEVYARQRTIEKINEATLNEIKNYAEQNINSLFEKLEK